MTNGSARRPPVSLALFRCELRVRDNPVLHAAARGAQHTVPLFVVDAGVRAAGFAVPNRAAFLAAGFLTKTLNVHWRVGARHFLDLLVDGDLANNQLNWQWAAGTGTRPGRVLNPPARTRRYDPCGDHARRRVPELAGAGGSAVHRPWRLAADLDCPEPLVEPW
ncbi:FAD-binding domain-containing protein [Streptomyces sp. MP131-18]|uniref:FAD-binding domain-containing protein n=1 Tax=Streptomyces sp. MP131-18 TaxID=1857892 RepID=UPI00097C462F|nr:FAD-binding domain-containing protein [Streptomyces sp. MP131-18]ONK12664.1 Deoxyribodipyrimidine photo-lyase [Streptomyces sp. MP131-18]